MPTDQDIEKKIQEKGLNAPRLTPEDIKKKIVDVTYTNLPSGKSVICEIILENGFSVRGESSCVSKDNFDQEIGNEIAYDNALEKIWQIEGYLLQEKVYGPKKPHEPKFRTDMIKVNEGEIQFGDYSVIRKFKEQTHYNEI